ncbi:MAG: LAGLIDADG family homing endonuclease, partial [Microthrixaceae bacterium]
MTLTSDDSLATPSGAPGGGRGERLDRRFTTSGRSPYDAIRWQRRDARLVDHRDGSVAFEQLDVEFPADWSLTASNIVAQKYFRGRLGTPDRESSVRQVIDRVVGAITSWGRRDGYFADEAEADTFADELRHLLVHQKVSFNSPVWFNIGVPGVAQQAAAGFILDVEDDLRSILNWYAEEGMIFKGGSGAGANLSKLRSSKEHLRGGGTASGPVSFMRGADASAGTIKSGGTTRRAAKMVILDVDHPDVEEFIWCKAREERKARVLRDAGFDMDLDGRDAISLQYQNANNSVRLSDEFMQSVLDDEDWELTARSTGEVLQRVPARELMRQIAEAAWECADPGVQFGTTINRWNTTPTAGEIVASNPCFTGDTLVHTDRGLIQFQELVTRVNRGEIIEVVTHDATHPEHPAETVTLTRPDAVMVTGHHPVLRLRFRNGMEVRATENHRFFTENRGFVRADELTEQDRVRVLDRPTPAHWASSTIPVPAAFDAWRESGDSTTPMELPQEWDSTFAHWLGWLIGDGCISGNTVTTIYGTAEERDSILPLHQMLIEDIGARSSKTTSQPNGTTELRISRGPFRRYLEALGVNVVKAPATTVPWSIEQAPSWVVSSFLQGLFDADGCVVHNTSKGSYVGLGSASPELLRGAQRLLSTFGIVSRIYRVRRPESDTGFEYTTVAGEHRRYESRTDHYDLRITGHSLVTFADEIGFSVPHKAVTLFDVVTTWAKGPYRTKAWTTLSERIDDGVELTYNLSEPRNHSYVVNGLVVSNCSEHLRLENSACNLASLNLLRFLDDDGRFDVESFEHAVRVVVTAQDVLVGASEYPTPSITEMTARSRDIGLGYTNLGACLMALGLPYDSDEGRGWAAAVTATLTGAAAVRSTELADRLGPAPLFAADRDAWAHVYDLHLDAARVVPSVPTQPDWNERLVGLWEQAASRVRHVGARNAELTVAAPTGTISFMMDADTTGIEPDLGLVKTKKLVGGGTLQIVNLTVPRALRRLGYDEEQIAEVVAYIAEHHSVLGAPHVVAEHLPVFACAMGDLTISYRGHLRMMAAIQPFFSGAMSKTVNVPEDTTVDQIEQLLIDAWRSGIKCVALYRDNCK